MNKLLDKSYQNINQYILAKYNRDFPIHKNKIFLIKTQWYNFLKITNFIANNIDIKKTNSFVFYSRDNLSNTYININENSLKEFNYLNINKNILFDFIFYHEAFHIEQHLLQKKEKINIKNETDYIKNLYYYCSKINKEANSENNDQRIISSFIEASFNESHSDLYSLFMIYKTNGIEDFNLICDSVFLNRYNVKNNYLKTSINNMFDEYSHLNEDIKLIMLNNLIYNDIYAIRKLKQLLNSKSFEISKVEENIDKILCNNLILNLASSHINELHFSNLEELFNRANYENYILPDNKKIGQIINNFCKDKNIDYNNYVLENEKNKNIISLKNNYELFFKKENLYYKQILLKKEMSTNLNKKGKIRK